MDRIFEVCEPEQLSGYRADWCRLLEATPHASFLRSADWLAARWRHAAVDEDVFVVVTTDGRSPTGFVPLCIQRERTSCGLLRTVRFPINGWGSFYGPISVTPAETLSAALSYLWHSNRRFDLVDLTPLYVEDAPPSIDMDAAPTTVPLAGQECHEVTRVAVLDLQGDWDSYWMSRRTQKNRRRNVERCERRLNELGTVRYERYRPDGVATVDPRWDLYEACEAIARSSWQDRLVEGNTMHHACVRPLLRDVHLAAVHAGAVDVNLLLLDERPIAFAYGYHFRGFVDLIRIGMVADLAKLAPGNALWTRLIRDSFARGDRRLDFGPACLDYKRFWTTRFEPGYALRQYGSSARAQALRLARWWKRRHPAPMDDSNRRSKTLAAARRADHGASPLSSLTA